MFNRSPLAAFFATLAFSIMTGCGVPKAIEKVGGSLEKSTTNVKEGAAQLASGLSDLAKIDPLGLNKLLNENESLRNTVLEIRARLDSSPSGEGRVVLVGRRVLLRVTPVVGTTAVVGWIGENKNEPFLSRDYVGPEVSYPLRFDVAAGRKADFKREATEILNNENFAGPRMKALAERKIDGIDEDYKIRVERAFNILRGSPGTFFASEDIDLHPRFAGAPGARIVNLSLTPRTQHAAVRIECATQGATGSEERIASYELNTRNLTLINGEVVTQQIFLDVRTSGGK